ncbi:MAG: hypothetical protein OH319_03140 [Candidatus Parvarchaeota archaeon]|nr:hypothetical protein [Candidatus Jingweiarchaeum tengchongense]MCW1298490.1 hypothetical protein [Candidatus Jingweiarchaeum tengchongense]MCW1300264.1 hypothetical protein [Candidatus Jingweiarchaeum tengchongense]MCW1304502.1 hypothetical protein [Candidatus Jingweiarchaeum tengchongense]MCW1305770.1 hypothetical protein [Candidatus Jingweiarchaeum tengchongense]
MAFEKERILKELYKKINEKEVDDEIIPTLDLINSIPETYSVSSCAGRICLIGFFDKYKKNESKFVFKSHKEVSVSDIWSKLKCSKLRNIWFNMEGVILHIKTKRLEEAFRILEIARKAGFKHSGAYETKYGIMIEIRDAERITFPIKVDNELMLNKKSFSKIISIANEKLMKTKNKLKNFNKLLC